MQGRPFKVPSLVLTSGWVVIDSAGAPFLSKFKDFNL